MEENEQLRLLKAIERNTEAAEKNLAATRSIAIFMIGWVGWFLAGIIFILLGGLLSLLPEDGPKVLGGIAALGGFTVILVGAIKAISNALSELAKSSK